MLGKRPRLFNNNQLKKIANSITPLFCWIWLVILLSIVLGILLWSIFGTVTVYVHGKGVIVNKSGIYTIQTHLKGMAEKFFVKPGDIIEKGNLVARIYDPQKEMLYKTTQIKISALRDEIEHLRHRIEVEENASKNALEVNAASLEFDIQTLQDRLTFLQRELRKKQGL